jgi:hypothetical protein
MISTHTELVSLLLVFIVIVHGVVVDLFAVKYVGILDFLKRVLETGQCSSLIL